MIGLGVWLVIYGAVGTACALIANSRGRSPVGWFFIGLFTPCFMGLVLVLVLPDLKVEQERQRRLADENRRLRERLRKDRMVADERHAEISRRVGAHDMALGIDTAVPTTNALPGGEDAPPPPPPAAVAQASDELRAASWFWAQGLHRQGPIAFEALRGLHVEGRVTGETLVWRKGMANWIPVRDVPGLEDTLDAR